MIELSGLQFPAFISDYVRLHNAHTENEMKTVIIPKSGLFNRPLFNRSVWVHRHLASGHIRALTIARTQKISINIGRFDFHDVPVYRIAYVCVHLTVHASKHCGDQSPQDINEKSINRIGNPTHRRPAQYVLCAWWINESCRTDSIWRNAFCSISCGRLLVVTWHIDALATMVPLSIRWCIELINNRVRLYFKLGKPNHWREFQIMTHKYKCGLFIILVRRFDCF